MTLKIGINGFGRSGHMDSAVFRIPDIHRTRVGAGLGINRGRKAG